MIEPAFLATGHFVVGCICVISGYIAFAAPKGQRIHRAAGACFLGSMVLLCASGLWLSLARDILFTVFLSWLAFHAVITGWAAAAVMRRLGRMITRLSPVSSGTMAVGAAIGAYLAARTAEGTLNGLPPEAFLVIAAIATLLCVLDGLFIIKSTNQNARRLTRHGWRMGFSMFLATAIFFFGNNHVLPEALRTPIVLAAPVILVVCLTLWFAIRTRIQTQV